MKTKKYASKKYASNKKTLPKKNLDPVSHINKTNWHHLKSYIVILFVQIVMLIIVLLPLFSIKQVYFSKNEEDKEKYSSLWVKIPFGLLCVVSIVVSLFIIWIIYGFARFYIGNEHISGLGVYSFMMAIPGAMILYLMLPLYIVYRMNVK